MTYADLIDMHMFVTGRVIAHGMRPEFAVRGTGYALDPGSLDAPEKIAAGSCLCPVRGSSAHFYPNGVRRDR